MQRDLISLGLRAGQLGLETVAGRTAAFRCVEIRDHGLDQRITTTVELDLGQRRAAGEAFLEQAPETTGLGRGRRPCRPS